MTLTSIKSSTIHIAAMVAILLLQACGLGSGSSTTGSHIDISAMPSPANIAAMPAGAKTFSNAEGNSITLTRAYLVISSATIETSCDASFSAMLNGALNMLLPAAQAHTESTPTATGEPVVIDLLAADNIAILVGELSPPAGDYCGINISLQAADADTTNLPTTAGAPDMIGKTLFIEGSYTLSGGGSGSLSVSTSATLQARHLLLSPSLTISADQLDGAVRFAIQYDTWFDALDLAALQNETSLTDPNFSQLLQNITASIHQ